ncbi:hypothetical protein E4U27_000768 [Claviceps purpurea]|nr:hypothetical protein E4U27_000768 [Claviceps purpurea]
MSGDDNVRREAELWALHARAQAAEERALEAERQHDAVVDYAREELRLRQAEQLNQWCEYKAPGVEEKLVLPVLYESPRWLPPHQMQIGLDGVNAIKLSHIMNPSHPAGYHITSEARRLAAAVITQLFDMMTKQEVRFGYVDTGRFKIFIRVGDDPTCVEYHLALPSDDVEGED